MKIVHQSNTGLRLTDLHTFYLEGLKGYHLILTDMERGEVPRRRRAERTFSAASTPKKKGKARHKLPYEQGTHSEQRRLEKQWNPRLSYFILHTPPYTLCKTVYSKGPEFIPCVSTRETCLFGKVRWLDSGIGTGVLVPEGVFRNRSIQGDVPMGTGSGLRLICLPMCDSPHRGRRPGENLLPCFWSATKSISWDWPLAAGSNPWAGFCKESEDRIEELGFYYKTVETIKQ